MAKGRHSRQFPVACILVLAAMVIGCQAEVNSMANQEEKAAEALTKLEVSLTKDPKGRIVAVGFMLNTKADEIAAILPSLPNLTYIDGEGSSLSDVAMKYIAECHNLEKLDFTNCGSISTNGIRQIRSLKKLRELHFDPKHDADSCMELIAEVKSLRILGLGYSMITDRGLASLASLGDLERLDLLGGDSGVILGTVILGTRTDIDILGKIR